MVLLSFLIKKFEYIRPLLDDLLKFVKFTENQATSTNQGEENIIKVSGDKLQSLAKIQIYLKNLKEIASTLLSKATKQDKQKDVNSEDSDDDPFLRNFKINDDTEEAKQKKAQEAANENSAEALQKKMDQFLILWLRQIVIYNTHYVLHHALANSNLTSILDVRPSVIKATNIRYALLSLMNPRLQSVQQIDNFKSMKKVLDNVVTYFFQNFLSVKERALVVEDLRKIKYNVIKYNSCKHLDLLQFFETHQEFKEFYDFMQMDYYISNTLDLELSLIKHTNKDMAPATLDRVYEVYKNGIEVFKHQGEHITQFCFDN